MGTWVFILFSLLLLGLITFIIKKFKKIKSHLMNFANLKKEIGDRRLRNSASAIQNFNLKMSIRYFENLRYK